MAKITFNNGITLFEVITDANYAYNLPCIGEDGKLYHILKLLTNESISDHPNATHYDEKLRVYLIPMCHQERVGNEYVDVQDSVENFSSKIFQRVTSIDAYINHKNELLALYENEDKVNKIKSLFDNDSNAFEMVKHLLCYRPEDLIESRTDWEDLLDYLREIFYFTEGIKEIIEKK